MVFIPRAHINQYQLIPSFFIWNFGPRFDPSFEHVDPSVDPSFQLLAPV